MPNPPPSDGAPEYLIWAERWLVGGAMQAPRAFVPSLDPSLFRDQSLGTIWRAIQAVPGEPSLPAVAAYLAQHGQLDGIGGEVALARLLTAQGAFLYAGQAAMAAHAGIVREWGDRRRRIAGLAAEAQAVHEGKTPHRGGVSFDYKER